MRRLLFALVLCAQVSAQLMAQNLLYIDSLKEALGTANESDKFEILYEISAEYLEGTSSDSAFKYINQTLEASTPRTDSSKIVRALRKKGQILRNMAMYEDAILVLRNALEVAERGKFTDEKMRILNALGICYTFKADYYRALKLHYKVLDVKGKDDSDLVLYSSIFNIGLVHYKLRDYVKAISYYERSYDQVMKFRNKDNLEILLINIGLCYTELKNFEKAKQFSEIALSKCNDRCNKFILISGNYGLGRAHFGEGNYREAHSKFTYSLDLAREVKDTRYIAENLLCLGKINLILRDFSMAESQFAEAELFARRFELHEVLLDVFRQQIELYKAMNSLGKLSLAQSKYIDQREKIHSEENFNRLSQLQIDFEEHEHLKTIEWQRQLLKQQRYLNLAIGCIGLLLIAILMLLSVRYREKKHANLLLETRVRERTKELAANRESVQRNYNNLLTFIRSASNNLSTRLATLKGMGQLPYSSGETAKEYNSSLIKVTDELIEISNHLKAQFYNDSPEIYPPTS